MAPAIPNAVRVLVVGDGPALRELVARALATDPRFEVMAHVSSAELALVRLRAATPDVVLCDLDLAGGSGLALVERLARERRFPVVAACRDTATNDAVAALDAGAADVFAKPREGTWPELTAVDLRSRILHAVPPLSTRTLAPSSGPPSSRGYELAPLSAGGVELFAIGASTGGPTAVETIVKSLPASCPPVVVVIHMPAGFTRTYATRLDGLSALAVCEAEDGVALEVGTVHVAPGGRQCRVRRRDGRLVIALGSSERIGDHAPSVDVLFESVAEATGRRTAAALLTGMGADGAKGLLALRKLGARTYAQDEATSVVFGMPKAAWSLGAVRELTPLDRIAARLLDG